jgi:tRNA pseudouridine38-40 synthase
MRAATSAFVGMKDFKAFTDDEPEEKSTRVLVDSIEIVESGALVLIRVQGSHFLWKMVRRLVGVLAAVGRQELKPADAARLLTDEKATTTPAALAAPAAGLFLEAVIYKGDNSPGPIAPVMNIGL